NPFTINPDTKIFSMRYKERQKAKAEREKMKTMKIHEKTTYSTKMKAQSKWFRKAMRQEEEEDAKRQAGSEERLETLQKMLSQNLAIKCDYPQKRQTRQEYKHAIREAFLLEYAMAVKREKIQRIKDIIEHEERELEKATQQLEKDASMFYEYLKKKQEKIVQVLTDARKATEAHTKKKRELEAINSQIENLKSDIAELKNTLQEYKTRKDFLYEQLPKEWQEKHGEKHKQDLRTLSKANEESASPPTTAEPERTFSSKQQQQTTLFITLNKSSPLSCQFSNGLIHFFFFSSLEDAETEISSDEDEEPQLYFTDPQQLLSIFMEQEEKVLSLIQHSTESEQSMDNILTKCNSLGSSLFQRPDASLVFRSRDKMAAELKQQVDALKSSIAKEEAKAADLRRKVLALSPGEDEEDDQDRMIKSLHNKVQEVYSQCTGDSETNLQTEQMLTVIERHVYKLLDNLEKIPPAKLEQILGVKKKEQWVRKKRRQEKQQQEERLKRALDRS
ncbi:CP100 protein, partial [Rhinopomastus cyanomelas]|nr:CP100 protein [Rhinopomastus cyanomelas]